MNGKIPHTQTDWTFAELIDYGFKPHTYYVFDKLWHRRWYNIFGDKLFEVPKTLNESLVTMCYGDYQICCDEWGYIDIFYSKNPSESGVCLAQLGKKHVLLPEVFDVIRQHKRGNNLEKFFDEN